MTDRTGELRTSPRRGEGHVRTRLAVWADRDALIALVYARRAECSQAEGKPSLPYWEDAAGLVEAHLTSSRRFYLIAEVDGVLVGFVQFTVARDRINIETQYIAPTYRDTALDETLRHRLEQGLHVQ